MEFVNPFEGPTSGLKVKDWVWHHSHKKTKYTALAKRMHTCFNLDDNKIYLTTLVNGEPIITEVTGER